MCRRSSIIIIPLLLCLASLVAQTNYRVLFDSSDAHVSGLEIKDAIQAMDGSTYIVGAQKTTNGDLNGLLMKMESSGKTEVIKTYGAGKEEQLNGIIQLPSGYFLLVGGSASNSADGRMEAWWLKVDYRGNVVTEGRLGHSTDRRITHVAQCETGKILFCGEDGAPGSGNIWMAFFSKKGIFSPLALGNGKYNDIITLEALPTEQFFLCGNYKGKIDKDEAAWYSIISADGRIEKEAGFGQIKKSENIKAGNQSLLDGSVALIGETSRQDIYGDVMIVQFDARGDKIKDTLYGKRNIDWAQGILPTLNEKQLLLAIRSNSAKGYENKLALLGTSQEYLIREKRVISIIRMVLDAQNHWVCIGTWRDRKETGLWRMGLDFNESTEKSGTASTTDYSAKGNTNADLSGLECTGARFVDGEDNILSPGEEGSLNFSLSNPAITPLIGVRVETQASNKVNGLIFDSPVFVSAIPGGGKRTVQIPIRTSSGLQAGKSNFDIKVVINGQVVCSSKATVTSMGIQASQNKPTGTEPDVVGKPRLETRTDKGRGSILTVTEPDVVSNPRLETRTHKDRGLMTIRGVSSTPANNATKTIYRNGIKVDDFKDILIKPKFGREGENFVAEYQITVPLDTGRNEFVLVIREGEDSIRSSPVVFYRTSRKPTLHLLAIAPPYQNLQYNGKDAKDLAAVLQRQKQSGIYDEVYINLLTEKEQTTRANLEKEFEVLYNKSKSTYTALDRIEDEDVLLVFISSHGMVYGDDFRILPSEYVSGLGLEGSTTLNFRHVLEDYIKKIKCKILILIDACHSGGAKDEDELSRVLNRLLTAAPGNLILASSSESESSYENVLWQNGAFTEALLEALNNEVQPLKGNPPSKADVNNDGYLSPQELIDFVRKRVGQIVQEINQVQTPKATIHNLDASLPLFKLNK